MADAADWAGQQVARSFLRRQRRRALLDCLRDGGLTCAWRFGDRHVRDPPGSFLLPAVHRLLP
ncbi:hypothetical protein AB0M48_36075 [Lentzea sp. NPDC051208]|uniref:hypothetical protein n=1 Tax=Lentzea sp. NPDC051208 TaxID=3154642 RepID=UPI00341D2C1C